MRMALFCATKRGYRFIEKVHSLIPEARLLVLSFKEEPWEPPFLEDTRHLAARCGAQFVEYTHATADRVDDLFTKYPVDVIFAVSWRHLIPRKIYSRAKLGAYVLHDSLLPEYRGFSPTVWAMMNGEDHTGATLLEMAEEFDAGRVIGQARVPIAQDDTIAEVMGRVTDSYLGLLDAFLPSLLDGTAWRSVQNEAKATYTTKLLPEDFRIDWRWPSARVYNLIRATTAPYSGAYCSLGDRRLKVWSARRMTLERRYVGRIPGRVVEVRPGEGSVVLTGDGALLVTSVQIENGPVVSGDQVLSRISHTLG